MSKHLPSILFVCTANRFRSIIAEAFFKLLLTENEEGEQWLVGSAGTWTTAGLPPLPEAIGFLKSNGMSIDSYRSREISRELLEDSDLIIVMTQGHREALDYEFPKFKEKIFLLSEVTEEQSFDIPDVFESQDETPEDLGNEICGLLASGFEKICEKARQVKM